MKKKLKPRLRGYFHRAAFYASLVIGLILGFVARPGIPKFSAIIYMISLINLYGVSSVLHLTDWIEEWVEEKVAKIDHASIFILIAGSYTPLCLLCTPRSNMNDGMNLLILGSTWMIAIAGVMKSIIWSRAPRIFNVGFYVTCGLTVVPFFNHLKESMSLMELKLFITACSIYLLGGVVYGAKYPNPWPKTFGFHEIFHVITIIGNVVYMASIVSHVI